MPDRALAAFREGAVRTIADAPRFVTLGRVARVVGQVIEATGLPVALGEICRIESANAERLTALVVGFHERGVLLVPLRELDGIQPGATVRPLHRSLDA